MKGGIVEFVEWIVEHFMSMVYGHSRHETVVDSGHTLVIFDKAVINRCQNKK